MSQGEVKSEYTPVEGKRHEKPEKENGDYYFFTKGTCFSLHKTMF